jgi:hypothetical protein
LRTLLPDLFASPARAVRELELLAALARRGLPVAPPLGALARRVGPVWRLRLLTELVEGAVPLPRFVAERPAQRRAAVREAGVVVARAFAFGLVHPDLHPENLIARARPRGGVDVWLLDLDRAVRRERVDDRERVQMWARMARWLVRHRARLPVAASATDGVRFLAGCGLDRAARRSALAAIAPVLRRAAARYRAEAWVRATPVRSAPA